MKSLAGVAQLHKAQPGTHGTSKAAHGGRGRDTVVLVPLGTVVSRILDGSATGTANENVGTADSEPAVYHVRSESSSSAPLEQQEIEEPDVPAWLARWRTVYTGTAIEEDLHDEFVESGQPKQSVADQAGAVSQDDADPPQRRKGPRQFVTELLADLVEDDQEVVVARGGRGGLGNAAMRAHPHR